MEPMMRYTTGYREFTTGNWTIRCSSGIPGRLVDPVFCTIYSYSLETTPTPTPPTPHTPKAGERNMPLKFDLPLFITCN